MNHKHTAHAKEDNKLAAASAKNGRAGTTNTSSPSEGTVGVDTVDPRSCIQGSGQKRREGNLHLEDVTRISHQILCEAAFMPVVLPQLSPKNKENNSDSSESEQARAGSFECPLDLVICTDTSKSGGALPLPQEKILESVCSSCAALERKLDNMYDDMEYMRGLALKNNDNSSSTAGCPHCSSKSSRAALTTVVRNEFQHLVDHHAQQIQALYSERVSFWELFFG
jgi:hypothetical protein